MKGTGQDTNIHFDRWHFAKDGRAYFYESTDDNKPSTEIMGVEGEIKYTWAFTDKDILLYLGNEKNYYKVDKIRDDKIFMTDNQKKNSY